MPELEIEGKSILYDFIPVEKKQVVRDSEGQVVLIESKVKGKNGKYKFVPLRETTGYTTVPTVVNESAMTWIKTVSTLSGESLETVDRSAYHAILEHSKIKARTQVDGEDKPLDAKFFATMHLTARQPKDATAYERIVKFIGSNPKHALNIAKMLNDKSISLSNVLVEIDKLEAGLS